MIFVHCDFWLGYVVVESPVMAGTKNRTLALAAERAYSNRSPAIPRLRADKNKPIIFLRIEDMRILTLLFLLALAGCGKKADAVIDLRASSGELSQETFDGCEYITFDNFNGGGITHKANCPNPIHSKQ